MAKLFIGIALLIMAVTAALGFLASGNINKLQSTLKGTKSDLAKTQGDLQTSKNEAKKLGEERDAANAKAEETAKNLMAKETELSAANTQLTEAKAAVETKTTALAQLQMEYDKIKGTPDKPAPPDPRVAELTEQLQKSSAELAEVKAVLENTTKKAEDDRQKLADLTKREADRQKGVARPGLQGRVLAVNAGWNFVVLSVGDKQGVIVNAPLLVVRGNVPVARLRVTSVEPSTSIADLIPGSIARGVTVQPGDTVIFEGRTPSTEAKPAGEPDSATPPPLPR